MWDELPPASWSCADIVDGERDRKEEEKGSETEPQRLEKRQGGVEEGEGGKVGSREEGVWEKVGSVANPTLSHKGNCLASCSGAS